jgi:hypothetical protein
MICPNCGFNSKEGVKFCGKCGKKLPDISDLFNLPDDSSNVSSQLPHNNNSEIINSTIPIESPEPKTIPDTPEYTYLPEDSAVSEQTTISNNSDAPEFTYVSDNPAVPENTSLSNNSYVSDNSATSKNTSLLNNPSTPANIALSSSANLITAQNESLSQQHQTDCKESDIAAESNYPANDTAETFPTNTKRKINLKRETPKKKIRRIGYSKVVTTPEFIAKLRQHNLKLLLKGLLLTFSPLIVLLLYSYFDPEITTSEAIKLGLGIAVIISFFLSFIVFKRLFGKSWEGMVMSKKFESRVRSKGKGRTETYVVYVLTLITDTGKTKFIEEFYHSGFYYNHFNVEDRVKYHPSFDYYEKFDKTNDIELLCPFCSNVVSIKKTHCSCGTPLIK